MTAIILPIRDLLPRHHDAALIRIGRRTARDMQTHMRLSELLQDEGVAFQQWLQRCR